MDALGRHAFYPAVIGKVEVARVVSNSYDAGLVPAAAFSSPGAHLGADSREGRGARHLLPREGAAKE